MWSSLRSSWHEAGMCMSLCSGMQAVSRARWSCVSGGRREVSCGCLLWSHSGTQTVAGMERCGVVQRGQCGLGGVKLNQVASSHPLLPPASLDVPHFNSYLLTLQGRCRAGQQTPGLCRVVWVYLPFSSTKTTSAAKSCGVPS